MLAKRKNSISSPVNQVTNAAPVSISLSISLPYIIKLAGIFLSIITTATVGVFAGLIVTVLSDMLSMKKNVSSPPTLQKA